MNFLFHLKKIDWWLVVFAVSLTSIGLVSIYSSSSFQRDFSNFKKQIFFFIIGFFLMIGLSFFDWRLLRESYLILLFYFLNVFVLAFLPFFGPEIRGVKGWYKIGPFTIDPIEPLKIILLILLAKYFSMRHVEMYNIKHILISGVYVFLPSFFIFLQPDLGSVLILIFLWFCILFFSGIKMRHFLILFLIFLFIFFFSWNRFLKEYQKQRIIGFIFPKGEPFGRNWSSLQAKIAIGSGRLFGRGFKSGSQTQLGFLTTPQTDFIFSSLAEEFGFLGIFFLFFLISILFFKIVKISFGFRTNFPRIFSIGFAALFFLETFIHVGMNLGILPVVGISLPLVSYGGSGLISKYVSLGILQSFKIHKD